MSAPTSPLSPISTVAVLGAGTMGRGIAQVCAAAGFATCLFDVDQALAAAGIEHIRKTLATGVTKGKVTQGDMDGTLQRLEATADLAQACTGAEMVVEAVPERLELKHQVFTAAAKAAPATAIFGTNTSSLSITKIAAALPDPSRVIGTHFFNPVHIMKLLEVVVGEQTAPEVVQSVLAWGAALGKQCITIKDSPGFATSRLGLVIGLEAMRMVEEGVGSPEDIDTAMILGYGFPMGPLRLTDLVGLDVRLAIAEYLSSALKQGQHFEPPALLRKMVAEGKLGKKSGQGFYRW